MQLVNTLKPTMNTIYKVMQQIGMYCNDLILQVCFGCRVPRV